MNAIAEVVPGLGVGLAIYHGAIKIAEKIHPKPKNESPVTTRTREVMTESQRKRAGLRRLSQDLRSGAVYQHAPTR